jgi:hypothetical protein
MEGPTSPLRARKDYDAPLSQEAAMIKDIPEPLSYDTPVCDEPPAGKIPGVPMGSGPHGPRTGLGPRGMGPKGLGGPPEPLAILICPTCDQEGGFPLEPPPGIPMATRVLKCAMCDNEIRFGALTKTASDGKYRTQSL